MSDGIILSEAELFDLTGYKLPTKQLRVLHARGFVRAYVGRSGVVLERTHYESVTKGEAVQLSGKKANLTFLKAA